jgi:hypothetical protein
MTQETVTYANTRRTDNQPQTIAHDQASYMESSPGIDLPRSE